MDRPLIWVWGTFVGLGAGTLVVTNSVAVAIAVGVSAGACVWLATSRIAAHWQMLVAAFSSAARGLPVKTADLSHTSSSSLELREAQSAAVAHTQNAHHLTLLRAALETMREGFWVTTEDGVLLEHNQTVSNLLQLPHELIGRHPREFLNDPELLGAVDDACRNHRASSLTLKSSGASARLRVHVEPLPLGRGSSALFMAF